MSEQQKYETVWTRPEYRAWAPGEELAEHFLAIAKPQPHQTVIDFGCGTGRGARRIAASGCTVRAFDLADNCLDNEVRGQLGERFTFQKHDLNEPILFVADFGYCTDVMEHLPPEQVEKVLQNIVTAARRVYFCICTVEDHLGSLIGEQLHLTVKPAEWWRGKLEALGCRIYAEKAADKAVFFWVSAYATFEDFEHRTVLNVEMQKIRDNIKTNLGLGLQQVGPYDAQDTEVMLLAGGPSLADFADEIYEKAKAGMPVITVNGAYNWAAEHGVKVGAQVIVDAREFNKRFTSPVVDTCKYLICSQCDPELVKSLPKEQTWLWHGAGDEIKAAIDEFTQETLTQVEWYPVPGGTTVTLRALPLLGMLGFRKIHVYGFDSCIKGKAHHAYEQKENDGMTAIPMAVNGKQFLCNGWMAVQAQQFQEVMRHILVPAGIELSVYGDGLIANILLAAANAAKE